MAPNSAAHEFALAPPRENLRDAAPSEVFPAVMAVAKTASAAIISRNVLPAGR